MNRILSQKYQILADQAIYSGTSFLMTMLMAHQLETITFGYYSAFVLTLYLAVSAISAWTLQVFQVANDKKPAYVSYIFLLQLVIMLMAIILIGLAGQLYGFSYSADWYFFGLGFIFYDFGRKLILSLQKTAEALLLDILISVLLIVAGLFLIFNELKDISDMFRIFAIVYGIAAIIIVAVIRPFQIRVSDFYHYTKRQIQAGRWLFFTAIGQWWAGNLFIVSSGIYLGAAALGALRLSQSLFGILNILLQAYENYVLPQTAAHLNNNLESGISYLKRTNQRLGWVFLPVLLTIFIFAKPVITLAGGSQYTPYAYVLQGWSVVYVFIYLSQPIRFAIRSLHLNRHFFVGYMLSLGFAWLSASWLLSGFGLYGVFTGLIISQVILMIYWIYILQQKNLNVWKSFI